MDWIPAIFSTSLLAVVLWLTRNLIITQLSRSVEHFYNKKIEIMRAELSNSEEFFKADFHSKSDQTDALRAGALSGVVNKHSVLYERQVKAVNEIR